MGIFDAIPSPYFTPDAVPESQLRTVADLYGRPRREVLPPPGIPLPDQYQSTPDFGGMPGMIAPRTPAFDPMAGSSVRAISAPATGLKALLAGDDETESTKAPVQLAANPLDSLTQQQIAALAGKTVSVGGGGGARSLGITTKSSAQIPGYREAVSNLDLAQRDAQIKKGEAEAEQAKKEALAHGGYLTAIDASEKAYRARQDAADAQIKAQESRFSAMRSDVAAMKPDPDRWMASRTTGQKAGMYLSAMLSGFVQGFRGQAGVNPTIALVQQEIDRDLDVQKATIAKAGAEVEQERGILGDLYRRTGDIRQAEQQARIMMNEGLSAKLKQIAATAQEPIARENAALAALGFDQQALQLKNASYQLEQGERVTHETRTAGSGGQKVSALQLLQQTALASQGFRTQMAELRQKEAKAKGEIADLENPSGKTKPLAEGGPVETMRKVNVARDALNNVWREAREVWTGKRELYGKSPFGSTWKSRLDDLARQAGQKVSDASGRPREEWTKSLIGRWDNAADIRQRLLDAHSALESEVQNSLETAAPKANVKPFVSLEIQKRQQIRQLYRPQE